MILFQHLLIFQMILMSLCDQQIEVWLTVYAQIESKDFWRTIPDVETERRLVLNWCHSSQNITNDWIGLFNTRLISLDNPIFKLKVNGTKGSHRTSHQIMNLDFNREDVINGCLKSNQNVWHIVYVRNNEIIAKNCFKTNPYWMTKSLNLIGSKRLDQIAIPGTHNAGCYHKYGINNIPTKSTYLYAQDESIFDQLIYGIRYFDMRIKYNELEEEYLQVVHNLWYCEHTVRDVLIQIKDFLEITTKEIVIFDIHNLHNFEDIFGNVFYERHQKLIDLIKEIVGKYLIPESYKYKTIEEILESNKRLVIGYVDRHKLKNMTDSELVWTQVTHLWPNHNSVDGIEKYFDRKLCFDRSRYLRSAMAQMTPTVEDVLFKFKSDNGLRQRADEVNPLFKQWFSHKWWNCINIVSADYFLGSDIVDIAIKVNERKFSSNKSILKFLSEYSISLLIIFVLLSLYWV